MKEDLFKIGEVAGLFNVSVSTMRHYEKLGLVEPEYVDPDTGYRYYSTDQFEVLNTLRYLRLLDTPLESISDFFHDRNTESMKAMLKVQREEVSGKINELLRLEKKIERRLQFIEEAECHPLNEIEDIMSDEARVVWLKYTMSPGSNDDIERSIKMLEGDQKEPMIFLGKVGIGLSPENLSLRKYDSYDMVFLILDDEDDFKGEFIEMPSERCLTIRFRGTHKDAPPYYDKLLDRMDEMDLRPAGPSREIALIDWGLSKDPDDFVTKIEIPVK